LRETITQNIGEAKILGLAFSRDRAMQLEYTLRSFFLHCTDAREAQLLIICEGTSDLHEKQYAQLAKEYDNVCFLKQKNFQRDVIDILLEFAADQPRRARRVRLTTIPLLSRAFHNIRLRDPWRAVLLMVDDNVFVREFSLRQVHQCLMEQQDALGFSLRLGTNTTYCYPLYKSQVVPPFALLDGQVMKFNWARDGDGDFGYPLEVSSSIYRVSELVPMLTSFSFSNPNTLEGSMASRANSFRERFPYLLCFKVSVTFCNPINIVQSVAANRVRRGFEYSSERLAQLFEKGYRIDVESYRGFISNACHQERDLTLILR
jgi:hypothetical protein